jgi:hypothetical protein
MRSSFTACAAAFGIVLSSAAGAADLPAEFNGMWLATEATNNRCVVADVKAEKNGAPVDRVMSVGPGEVAFYETRCKITSVKPIRNVNPSDTNQRNVEATLACTGEGMLWNTREIWHVETIDGSKVVVVTSLSQTNYRDDKGRRQNTPSLITTSIYYACRQ